MLSAMRPWSINRIGTNDRSKGPQSSNQYIGHQPALPKNKLVLHHHQAFHFNTLGTVLKPGSCVPSPKVLRPVNETGNYPAKNALERSSGSRPSRALIKSPGNIHNYLSTLIASLELNLSHSTRIPTSTPVKNDFLKSVIVAFTKKTKPPGMQ